MALQCPACGNRLSKKTVAGIEVDVCEGGCAGIWFDNLELKKFDEQHEHAGEELLDVQRNPDVQIDYEAKHKCPCCDDVTMMRHFFTVKRQVAIDECGSCGGVWLDAGDLRAIRQMFKDEQQGDQAFESYFEDVFGETMRMERQETQEKLDKIRNSVRAFRFICPSYYIPGKQDWGAF